MKICESIKPTPIQRNLNVEVLELTQLHVDRFRIAENLLRTLYAKYTHS